MELVDAIFGRRSVRDFTDEPIGEGTVRTLIHAAMQAPSAMNSQPWAFVVIQDERLLRKFSDRAKLLCAEAFQTELSSKMLQEMLTDPSFNIFYDSGTLIIICAQPVGQHPDRDCCLAAQNFDAVAHDMGLGTCPIGLAWPLFEEADVKSELNIPAKYTAIMPIIVGYPHTKPAPVERKPPDIRSWK